MSFNMYDVAWHEFATLKACAHAVSGAVAAQLCDAIDARGRASVALSGGSTPRRMLSILANAEVDWTKVTIMLVDERWCSHEDPSSNFRMISEGLNLGRAGAATMIPMWHAEEEPDVAARRLSAMLDGHGPLDVVVLGMGTDAHTASWIPQAHGLDRALSDDAPKICVVRPTDGRHVRLTMTRRAVCSARTKLLHLHGRGKQDVLRHALAKQGGWHEFPVRAALSCGSTSIYVGEED